MADDSQDIATRAVCGDSSATVGARFAETLACAGQVYFADYAAADPLLIACAGYADDFADEFVA
jgi:hypothetical protein